MKHNKKRNTAFIYETLARGLTKAIVDQNSYRKNKIVAILKEFFTAGSVLANELEFYNILLETKNIQPNLAEKILQETKSARRILDESQIFDSQSRLIAVINKTLGPEAWATFVPNYKVLASVNAIFSSKGNIKKKVLFEQSMIDRMSREDIIVETERMKSLDNLTYNSFIKKFNKKYNGLLTEQQELLNRYITSFADDGFELRLYLNEELSRLKGFLSKAAKGEIEPLISQKVGDVTEYLEGFRKREFTEIDLNKILKTQELVHELIAK